MLIIIILFFFVYLYFTGISEQRGGGRETEQPWQPGGLGFRHKSLTSSTVSDSTRTSIGNCDRPRARSTLLAPMVSLAPQVATASSTPSATIRQHQPLLQQLKSRTTRNMMKQSTEKTAVQAAGRGHSLLATQQMRMENLDIDD